MATPSDGDPKAAAEKSVATTRLSTGFSGFCVFSILFPLRESEIVCTCYQLGKVTAIRPVEQRPAGQALTA